MTGLYPDQTKSKKLRLYVRQTIPDVVTLGQKFRTENYHSVRVGKIYHYHNPRDIGTAGHDDSFTWDRTGGDPIKQGNRNPLLYKNLGADGIKTGYLAVEKYSLASSINRNGRRLIAVGSGFNTKNARSKESSKLLTYGLTNYDLVKISNKNESLHNVDVWLGKENSVDVYTNQDIYKTIKKAKKKLLKVSVKYEGPIEAPIKKDEKIAILKVVYDDELIGKYDLLASKEVKKVNFVSRLLKSLNYLIWGDV